MLDRVPYPNRVRAIDWPIRPVLLARVIGVLERTSQEYCLWMCLDVLVVEIETVDVAVV